jgi:hypothetical protein
MEDLAEVLVDRGRRGASGEHHASGAPERRGEPGGGRGSVSLALQDLGDDAHVASARSRLRALRRAASATVARS